MVIKTLIEQIFYNSGCICTEIWIPFPNFLFISDKVGAAGLVMGTNSLGRILLLCGISEWPHCCVSTKFLCSGISPLLLCAHHISTSQLDSSRLASLFVNLVNIWDMAHTIYSKFSCSLSTISYIKQCIGYRCLFEKQSPTSFWIGKFSSDFVIVTTK